MQPDYDDKNNIIAGRNPVMEALKAGRSIDCILTCEKNPTGSLKPIISKAKDMGIPIKETLHKKLDSISPHVPHQGVIAMVCAKEYCSLEDIIDLANSKNENPFIIIADSILDPHNLGAIIRTAECAGVHGVIIPKRRSVGLTSIVEKSSAGALEHMLIARESNISSTIDKIKKLNIWVYGADMSGKPWCKQNLTGGIALVIGSEGTGISRLVKEKCDILLSIPTKGNVSSLNASAACAVIAYEIVRQRMF